MKFCGLFHAYCSGYNKFGIYDEPPDNYRMILIARLLFRTNDCFYVFYLLQV